MQAIRAQTKMVAALHDSFDELCGTTKILDEIKRLSSEIHSHEKKYERIISRRAKLYIDLKSGTIEKKAYDRRKAALINQVKTLNDTIDTLRRDRESVSCGMDFAQANLGVFLKYQSLTQLDRAVLLDLVDVIHIFEGGKVEVTFLLKKEIKAAMDFIERFI